MNLWMILSGRFLTTGAAVTVSMRSMRSSGNFRTRSLTTSASVENISSVRREFRTTNDKELKRLVGKLGIIALRRPSPCFSSPDQMGQHQPGFPQLKLATSTSHDEALEDATHRLSYDSLDPKQPILPAEDCAGLLRGIYS